MSEGTTRTRQWRSPGPGDAVVGAGAVLVLGLLATAFVVVDPGSGPTVRSFTWVPEEPPAGPPAEEPGILPPLAPAAGGEVAPPTKAPTWSTITGNARVFASGPAKQNSRQPTCDHAWAPQVRMDDGTRAEVSVPGRLSGLVVINDWATWTCDFTYRAQVRTDSPAGPAHVQVPGGTGTRPYSPYGF